MPRPSTNLMGNVLAVMIPTVLAYVWGLSWATGDFPDCGSGREFLADLGWLMGGFLLGLILGVALPPILTRRVDFPLLVVLLVAAGVGVYVAGDAGATHAARLVGCDVGHVRDAGEMLVLGMALGAVPTTVLIAIARGIGWLLRPRP